MFLFSNRIDCWEPLPRMGIAKEDDLGLRPVISEYALRGGRCILGHDAVMPGANNGGYLNLMLLCGGETNRGGMARRESYAHADGWNQNCQPKRQRWPRNEEGIMPDWILKKPVRELRQK